MTVTTSLRIFIYLWKLTRYATISKEFQLIRDQLPSYILGFNNIQWNPRGLNSIQIIPHHYQTYQTIPVSQDYAVSLELPCAALRPLSQIPDKFRERSSSDFGPSRVGRRISITISSQRRHLPRATSETGAKRYGRDRKSSQKRERESERETKKDRRKKRETRDKVRRGVKERGF